MYVVKAKNAADNGWTTIYDSSDKALCLISQPKHSAELNQPGSFDFMIYPDSDFYDAVIPMATFISAFEGTDAEHLEETFYGRVLTCEEDFYGIKNVGCEGALSFLSDATVGYVSTDDKKSGKEETISPEDFLRNQLTAYNGKVEELKRLSYGGIIGVSVSETELFKIDDYQNFLSLFESQLIDVHGGFFKITRQQDGTHALSYVNNYGIDVGTAQPIKIGQNILDKQKHMTGEGVFTFIRPVGKDGVRLDSGTYHGVSCTEKNGWAGLYPVGTDAASFNALYARYGFIEKTKSFDHCESSGALAGACSEYVSNYGLDGLDKLPLTFDVKLVDFFNANPNVKRIELGANYILTVDGEGRETGFDGHADGTSLQEGQEGLTLTVYSIDRDYENPENDSIVFYNATYLTAKDYSVILSSMTGSSGRGGSRSGLSGLMASKSIEEQEQSQEQFKQFETFYTKTDEKFSWLATESEWDELAQAGHVTAFTQLDRTARYVEDTAKMELPFADWKTQWLTAHPEDKDLSDTELRVKYNEWITANPYAIYNTEYSDATRTERIVSKTGINYLGENETIYSKVSQTESSLRGEIRSSVSGVYSEVEQTLNSWHSTISDEVSGYKSEILQTNNTFKAEIHNIISDIYSRVISWEGGSAIEIRQGNRVFKQFDPPPYNLSDGDTLQVGDIWVKSTDMRTWGDTRNKAWGDAKDFHWDDYVGDEVYVWKDGRWQRVLSEKELVVQGHRFQVDLDETWDVIANPETGLRVEMSRTASRFYQTYTTLDGRTSTLEQSADQIRAEVSDAQSNIASLQITSSQIEGRVQDAEGNISTLTQTASGLTSRVENAEHKLSTVEQTADSVALTVRTKTRTFIQWQDPRATEPHGQEDLVVGDIWIKTNDKRNWGEAGQSNWQDSTGYKWDDYRGNEQYVWRGSPRGWELINSQKDAVVNAARFQVEQDRLWAVVDDNDNSLRAEMEMTASRFYQTYTDGINGLSSTIEQTASQIRSEVSDTKNGLQSSITQTASQIRSEVSDTKNGLQSSITQTASQIRSEISDTKNGLQSSITQTASQIRSEVSDTKNGLQTSITQNKNNIALKVSKGDVHTQLALDAGNVSVKNGNLVVDGYVTANELKSVKADITNLTTGQTTAVNLRTSALHIHGGGIHFHSVNGGGDDVDNVVSLNELAFGTNTSTKLNVIASKALKLGLQATEKDDGTITISFTNDGKDANFKIADTAVYQKDVSAAWDAGWQDAAGLTVPPEKGTSTSFVFKAPKYYEKTQDNWVSEQVSYNFSISKGATPSSSGYASVKLGSTVVGRIDIGNWYDTGKSAMGVVADTENNSVAVAETSTKSLTVTAVAGISYNSSTHKYTATATAKAGNTELARTTKPSGTEAYDAGWQDAANKTEPPETGTNSSFIFKAPKYYEKTQDNWVSEQVSYNFSISKGATPSSSGYASVALGNKVVGRIGIGNWYTAGHDSVVGNTDELQILAAGNFNTNTPYSTLPSDTSGNTSKNVSIWFKRSNGSWYYLRDGTVYYDQSSGDASASDINLANAGSIWSVGGWNTVPPALSGKEIIDLGSLSSKLSDADYGDSVIFRACIGPENSATSFKYYRIKVGYS